MKINLSRGATHYSQNDEDDQLGFKTTRHNDQARKCSIEEFQGLIARGLPVNPSSNILKGLLCEAIQKSTNSFSI